MTATDSVKFKGLRGQLKRNEPMSRHVTWRAGGRADRLFAPADPVDLAQNGLDRGPLVVNRYQEGQAHPAYCTDRAGWEQPTICSPLAGSI